MAENTQLDAFLSGGREAAPAEAQEPPQPVEPPPAPTEPQPQAAPQAPSGEADDTDPPAPLEGETAVPRRAFEDERRKRQDWKEQAIRAQVERDELRKQLEARQEPPRQAPPPQIDIREAMAADPAIKAAVLTRLDTSEMLLRERLGDEAVNQLQQDFTAAMARDPTLQARVLVQRDPYRWAMKHLESIKLYEEIGDDPAGWREKQRAAWEAERANGAAATPQQPRVSPAAGMAPSLASARSAAPRSAPAWTGPRPLESIVGDIRRR